MKLINGIRKIFYRSIVCFICTLLSAGSVYAQGFFIDFDNIEIETVQIDDGVYVLMGGPAQGNILVSAGDDGIFMVDSMYAQMHDRIMSALAEISDQPVRYVVNTHLHGDHTAGNAALAEAGAIIISQQNTKTRMLNLENAPPALAIPSMTYSSSMTLQMNGEVIDIFWPEPAHTDGDSLIYFRNANVLHVGDVPSSVRYPNIGINDGGTVAGMMAAAELILEIADPDTKIIAGHLGPVVGFEEIVIQQQMFEILSARIQDMIDEGLSLEEVLAAKPSAEFDEARVAGAIRAEQFVTLVFTDLSR